MKNFNMGIFLVKYFQHGNFSIYGASGAPFNVRVFNVRVFVRV